MDDFDRKKIGSKGKNFNILRKCFLKFLTDTLAKVHKIFLHILLFQRILGIFFVLRKKNAKLEIYQCYNNLKGPSRDGKKNTFTFTARCEIQKK